MCEWERFYSFKNNRLDLFVCASCAFVSVYIVRLAVLVCYCWFRNVINVFKARGDLFRWHTNAPKDMVEFALENVSIHSHSLRSHTHQFLFLFIFFILLLLLFRWVVFVVVVARLLLMVAFFLFVLLLSGFCSFLFIRCMQLTSVCVCHFAASLFIYIYTIQT